MDPFGKTTSSQFSDIARQIRDIMSSALTKAGFINYPREYRHWSFGNRHWDYHIGAKEALYIVRLNEYSKYHPRACP